MQQCSLTNQVTFFLLLLGKHVSSTQFFRGIIVESLLWYLCTDTHRVLSCSEPLGVSLEHHGPWLSYCTNYEKSIAIICSPTDPFWQTICLFFFIIFEAQISASMKFSLHRTVQSTIREKEKSSCNFFAQLRWITYRSLFAYTCRCFKTKRCIFWGIVWKPLWLPLSLSY